MKKALITGITGQDGSYLAELLLSKGYEVHGIKRRSSSFNTQRIDHLFDHPHLKLHYGDLSDSSNLTRLLSGIRPDEIYNLGAQSHVAVSFECPEYTADIDALGTLRLLEAIRFLGMEKTTRFYQASSSELYGQVRETPQTETTPFHPRSPYAVAKLFSYWAVRNYREAYGMFASNGILYNHESPRRSETFVTRKIVRGLARIARGEQDCLYLGNLDALRDWGHAKDFVKAMWMMLQHHVPDDFVIATGRQISVREFCFMAARNFGFELVFLEDGGHVDRIIDPSKCPNLRPGDRIIRTDPRLFRPAEVQTLLGDATKAKNVLGWTPTTSVERLCAEMCEYESHRRT